MQFSWHDKNHRVYSCQPKLGWEGTELMPAVNHHSSLPMGGYRASYVYHQRHRHNTGGSHDLCGRQILDIIHWRRTGISSCILGFQFYRRESCDQMLFYFLPQPSFTFFTGGNKSLPIPPPEKELQIHIHEFYRILMAFLFINVVGIFFQC